MYPRRPRRVALWGTTPGRVALLRDRLEWTGLLSLNAEETEERRRGGEVG